MKRGHPFYKRPHLKWKVFVRAKATGSNEASSWPWHIVLEILSLIDSIFCDAIVRRFGDAASNKRVEQKISSAENHYPEAGNIAAQVCYLSLD